GGMRRADVELSRALLPEECRSWHPAAGLDAALAGLLDQQNLRASTGEAAQSHIEAKLRHPPQPR
ncbi:MAG: hypothetical protein LH475_05145, partial [Cryobacterium sp.]|uniref:hypothetical protein n=1 Tax=Cryobacterium sp. TaxID=1926290 RepID=UPI0022A0E706